MVREQVGCWNEDRRLMVVPCWHGRSAPATHPPPLALAGCLPAGGGAKAVQDALPKKKKEAEPEVRLAC